MKHLGDITKISGYDAPVVDIVTGGSPCQDLSVAGKRVGLAGERSGLFMEQIRIIKEMRENDRRSNGRSDVDIRPRYMVWENVPGAFSSNKGEDFRCVLEETAKIADNNAVIPRLATGKDGKQKWSKSGCILGDGWSIAWRVHDAQLWGVPQRRKRIALVADFGGETAPEILFECKGLPGDTEESGKERKGAAEDAEGSIRETGKCLNSWDVQSKHIQPEEGIAEALYSGECRGGGGESYVMQSRTISLQERAGKPRGGKGILIQNERTGALSTLNNQSVCAFEPGAASRVGGHIYENKAGSLRTNAGDNQQAVVLENHPNDSRVKIREDGKVQTLSSRMGTGGGNVPMVMAVESHAQDSRYKVGDVNQPLSANMEHDPANGGLVMGEAYCVGNDQLAQARISDKVGALNCMHDQQAVITMTTEMTPKTDDEDVAFSLRGRDYKDPQCVTYGLDRASYNQGINAKYDFSVEAEKIATQTAKGPGAVYNNYIVRRLTPLECERLQGFPDDWTNIGEWVDSKGKKHKDADSPRYKALGNSIALPFWQYLADKMCAYLEDPTMASLFDGISGFCLVFARAGAKPVFSSEIEEFPIAVAKKHFGDDEKGVKGDYEKYL